MGKLGIFCKSFFSIVFVFPRFIGFELEYIYYKKITVLQRIFSLQIRCKPIKIRCKFLLATNLQYKCSVAKKPCCNFAHFDIRLQKTNGFATELFRCYIATNFKSVANSVAKSQKSNDNE